MRALLVLALCLMAPPALADSPEIVRAHAEVTEARREVERLESQLRGARLRLDMAESRLLELRLTPGQRQELRERNPPKPTTEMSKPG